MLTLDNPVQGYGALPVQRTDFVATLTAAQNALAGAKLDAQLRAAIAGYLDELDGDVRAAVLPARDYRAAIDTRVLEDIAAQTARDSSHPTDLADLLKTLTLVYDLLPEGFSWDWRVVPIIRNDLLISATSAKPYPVWLASHYIAPAGLHVLHVIDNSDNPVQFNDDAAHDDSDVGFLDTLIATLGGGDAVVSFAPEADMQGQALSAGIELEPLIPNMPTAPLTGVLPDLRAPRNLFLEELSVSGEFLALAGLKSTTADVLVAKLAAAFDSALATRVRGSDLCSNAFIAVMLAATPRLLEFDDLLRHSGGVLLYSPDYPSQADIFSAERRVPLVGQT